MKRLVFHFSSSRPAPCNSAASGLLNRTLDLQRGAEQACALVPRTVLVWTFTPFCRFGCESRNTQQRDGVNLWAAQGAPELVCQHCVGRQGLQLFTSSYREGARGETHGNISFSAFPQKSVTVLPCELHDLNPAAKQKCIDSESWHLSRSSSWLC